jgi:hypothetical protein
MFEGRSSRLVNIIAMAAFRSTFFVSPELKPALGYNHPMQIKGLQPENLRGFNWDSE